MRKWCLVATGLWLAGCGAIQDRQDINEAKTAIRERLNDPASAEFKNLHIARVSTPQGSFVRSVCGEINAKNAFGGYVGFRPFAYVLERRLSPAAVAHEVRLWEKGDIVILKPSSSQVADLARICSDGSTLTEDDVNLITPDFSAFE